ncbi:MAG TPA: PEP-CTERM system TPR-repeat protein PrsT [Alteromonas sp.]|nr:PEP-CTERM system TPR-repeat protein PrsT [Alteromonas sp.]
MKKSTVTRIAAISALLLLASGCGQKTTDEHISEAKQHLEQGDNKAAIIALKNAIQLDPQAAQPRFELGKIYLQEQDYESAEKELSRALDYGYKPADVLPLLSKAFQQTRADVAMTELPLESSGLSKVDKVTVGYRKALSLLTIGENKQAVLLSENLTALNVNSVYHDLIQLIPLLAAEKYEEAVSKAEQARDRSPLNSDALLILGRLYTSTGQGAKAVESFKGYLRVEPTDIRVKFILASLLIQQRDAKQAEPLVDELLAVNSKSPYLNQLKSIARAVDNDYESALKYAEIAINTGRLDPTLRVVAGFAAYKTENYDKAVEHLSTVASLLPDDHSVLRLLAASQVNSSTSAQVKSVIERLDSFKSTDVPLLSKAALEMLKADDEAAASEMIEQIESLSQSAEQIVQLNLLRLSVDDIDGLIGVDELVEDQEVPVQAKQMIALALIKHGKYDEAKAIAKELKNHQDTAFSSFIIDAEAALAEGDLTGAKVPIEEALSEQPNAVPAQVLKMRLLEQQGQQENALTLARKIVTDSPSAFKAWQFLLTQDKEQAQQDLSALINSLESGLTNPPLRMLAAQKALEFDQKAQALKLIKDISLSADSPQTLWQLKGNVLVQTNQVSAAEEHFRQWSEFFPNQEKAAIGVIAVNNIRGNYPAALAEANRFLQLEDNQEIRILQALFNARLGNLEAAKAAWSKIDERLYDEPEVRGISAYISLLERRPADALDDALLAYKANRSFDNLALITRIYAAQDQRNEALALLQEHNATPEKDIRSLMLMAEYQMLLAPDKAVASYKEAIAADPYNYVALNNLAYLKMNQAELDEARELIEQAYQFVPTNDGVVDTYAEILTKQGEADEAIVLYETIIEQPGVAEHIRLNYVETLLKQGSKAIAQRKLERMRFSQPASFVRLNSLIKQYELKNVKPR